MRKVKITLPLVVFILLFSSTFQVGQTVAQAPTVLQTGDQFNFINYEDRFSEDYREFTSYNVSDVGDLYRYEYHYRNETMLSDGNADIFFV